MALTGAALGLLLMVIDYANDIVVRVSGPPAILGFVLGFLLILVGCAVLGEITVWLARWYGPDVAQWGWWHGRRAAVRGYDRARQHSSRLSGWAAPRWDRRARDSRAAAGTGALDVPEDATHVLSWARPSVSSEGRNGGYWFLQELADWREGIPVFIPMTGPRSTPVDELAKFAALVLGHPVTLTRTAEPIRRGRWLAWAWRWHFAPAYYVSPAPDNDSGVADNDAPAEAPPGDALVPVLGAAVRALAPEGPPRPDPAPPPDAPASGDPATEDGDPMPGRMTMTANAREIPAVIRAVITHITDFQPVDDTELHQFLISFSRGMDGIADAIAGLHEYCLSPDVRLGKGAVATLATCAETAGAFGSVFKTASTMLDQYYGGVSEEIASGVELPRDGDFLTGDGGRPSAAGAHAMRRPAHVADSPRPDERLWDVVEH
jgi:hypothetical protein